MSMTREQAIKILREELENLLEYREAMNCGGKFDQFTADRKALSSEALSTLAPEPRTEPPTKEEVGDEEWCIGFSKHAKAWTGWTGKSVRHLWGKTFVAWLPMSALPKGDV